MALMAGAERAEPQDACHSVQRSGKPVRPHRHGRHVGAASAGLLVWAEERVNDAGRAGTHRRRRLHEAAAGVHL